MVGRLIGCTWLAAASMTAQQFHIDHVTVAGKNVEAMQKALSTVAGITAQYGGPHSNHATEMALASFSDGSYLELIAIQPKADPAALAAHYWDKFMEADAGPCSWAIRPADFGAELQRLRVAKVEVSEPNKSGRKRPDGVQLDWETAQVGPTNGGFFPFLIHDFTPRDNRAFPGGKPASNGWSGVAKVVIAVRDLDAAIAKYRQAYWIDPPQRQEDDEFGAKLAWFRGTPVVLAAPLSDKSSAKSWLSDRLERFGEAPAAFILGPRKGSVVIHGTQSKWFGHSVVWADAQQLGWHLGFEPK
ncbi:MAG: VOC family protein [Bryobacteraceae bacterium]